MVELEADDGLASAAHRWPGRNEWRRRVSGPRIRISPNVSLTSAWCKWIAGAAKFAMQGASAPNWCCADAIPDYLALVVCCGWLSWNCGLWTQNGGSTHQLVMAHSNSSLSDILKDNFERALLFKKLATLRTDALLFGDVEEMRWRGTTPSFASLAEKIGAARLAQRVRDLEKRLFNKRAIQEFITDPSICCALRALSFSQYPINQLNHPAQAVVFLDPGEVVWGIATK